MLSLHQTVPEGSLHACSIVPVRLGARFGSFLEHLLPDSRDHIKWTLISDRCQCCEYLPQVMPCCAQAGRRELAHIKHTLEKVGEASMVFVEVAVPEVNSDGSPAAWCTRRGGIPLQQELRLTSRRP